jgi:hypothetical protein
VGKCELVGKANEYSVGAVKCDNDEIGPHLSPKMFTATSGEDLYNLWLSVGPSFDEEPGVVERQALEKEEEEEEDVDDDEEEAADEESGDEEEYDEEEEEYGDDDEEGHDEF